MNESIIVIQAEATSPNRTNVVFWSHDRGTAKLRMKLVRKDGIPQSLPEGTTVPIRLMFKSATAEGGYGKHDYLATVEDPVNGIVSIVLEDNILGYVGTVEGSVYIDFPNDRSLDTAGRFTFYIKRSPIDDSTPELENYYFNGFSQTIDKIEKILADGKQEIEQKITKSETQIDAKVKDTNDKITKANQDVATLNTNIDKANDRIDQANQEIDKVLSGANEFRTDIDTLKNNKADKTFVTAQLAQNGADDLFSKKISYDSLSTKPAIYQAVVKNPSNVNYENKPFGIYISFEKGECPSEKRIVVKNAFGMVLPSQWEEDRHPRTGEKMGAWEDGSLKNGTIWTLGNLNVGETKVFTIEVSAQDVNQKDNVPQTIVEADVQESYLANGITYLTHKNASWGILSVTKDGTDLALNTALQATSIKNDAYTDLNSSKTGNTTVISKTIEGTGVVFKDIISKFSYVYNSNIVATFRTRIWANGDVDWETKTETIADVASGVLNGVMEKIQWNPISGATLQAHDHELYSSETGSGHRILAGFRWHQRHGEDYDSNNYPIVTNSVTGKAYVGWQNASPNTFSIPNKAYWTANAYVSLAFDNVDNERLRRINRLFTRASKENARTLKRKFNSLAKFYVENMRDWNLFNGQNLFPGINGLESIGLTKLSGDDLYTHAVNRFDLALSYYSGGTKEGFVNAWQTENWRRGIQYIGRDMSILTYLHKEAVKRNDLDVVITTENVIHNLADAFVEIEALSGGQGKVALRGDGVMETTTDAMNPEATAIKYIKQSLDLLDNDIRKNCMNRIIERFNNTVQYNTRLPYAKIELDTYYDFLVNPRLHYHAFALFDYLQAVENPPFDIRQLAFEVTNGSGQIKEVGYQYQQERRGLASTAVYLACVLYKAGNISDLEQACKIVEYIITNMYPVGGHIHPIDGWSNTDQAISGFPLETQALIETVLSQ